MEKTDRELRRQELEAYLLTPAGGDALEKFVRLGMPAVPEFEGEVIHSPMGGMLLVAGKNYYVSIRLLMGLGPPATFDLIEDHPESFVDYMGWLYVESRALLTKCKGSKKRALATLIAKMETLQESRPDGTEEDSRAV